MRVAFSKFCNYSKSGLFYFASTKIHTVLIGSKEVNFAFDSYIYDISLATDIDLHIDRTEDILQITNDSQYTLRGEFKIICVTN